MQDRCISDETLRRFLSNELSKEEQTNIETHLNLCAKCRRRLLEATEVQEEQEKIAPVPEWLMAKVLQMPESSKRAARSIVSFRTGIAAAAAVMIIALGVTVFLLQRNYSIDQRLLTESNKEKPVESSAATTSYWTGKYGRILKTDHALAARADRIFSRLLQVVEIGMPHPNLIVVGASETPYALALRDGNIVLTEKALHLCFDGVAPEQGDTRLAFVIGHELVHRKNHSFTHLTAFAAMKSADATPDRSPEKELEADAYGLIYTTLAGYDPRQLMLSPGDFIQQWALQEPQNIAYEDQTHPAPEKRAESLRKHLQDVANHLDYFHFGVRLYQLGRYEDAIALLRRFAQQFPSREVSNNLGLCHYQMAMKKLSACDPPSVEKIYLSTILDPQTLALKFRSEKSNSCLKDTEFLQPIQNAEQYFRNAISQDPSYLPARVNLSSVQIVMRRHAEAFESLDAALKIKPEDPAVLNNHAAALYLQDPNETDSSLGILRLSLQSESNFAPAIYNRAVLEAQKGSAKESRELFEKFLLVESTGLFARSARKKLGIKENLPLYSQTEIFPPVPLGEINGKTKSALSQMETQSISAGQLRGAFYNNNEQKILVLDGMVELIETAPPATLNTALLQSPHRTIPASSGSVQIYRKFGVEVQEGRVQQIFYFE